MKKRKNVFIWFLAIFMGFMLPACGGAPELQEGERYFEGDIPFEYAQSCKVSYILSADGQSIRDTRIAIKNLSYNIPYHSGGYSGNIRESIASNSISFSGVHKLDENGNVEIPSREVILRFSITPNGVSGEMEYSYKTKAGDTPSIELLLGTYPFVMEDKTDSLGE